jgi:hypothetical protein
MTTNREITRFIANLPDDETVGFDVLIALCSSYEFIGVMFGRSDIAWQFAEVTHRDMTENDYEELTEMYLDEFEDYLQVVALERMREVISKYVEQQEESK